jgi:hypothetical protein
VFCMSYELILILLILQEIKEIIIVTTKQNQPSNSQNRKG